MPPERERTPWPWSEKDLIRLRHILDAARQIEIFVSDRTRESLRENEIATLGLVKAIEIIGEAAFVMDHGVLEAIPDVPWDRVIGMRHRLVHAYFEVDHDIVWATATKAVPELADSVRRFLDRWDPVK